MAKKYKKTEWGYGPYDSTSGRWTTGKGKKKSSSKKK